MFTLPAEMGTWTVNSLEMHWSGAKPLNMEVLWSAPPWEHENLYMPEVDGSLPRDPVQVEAVHTVHYVLSGFVLANGDPASDSLAGFRSNYEQLRTRCGTPTSWSGSSVASQIAKGATTRSANIQPFLSPFPDRGRGSVIEVDVMVVVPAGAFA